MKKTTETYDKHAEIYAERWFKKPLTKPLLKKFAKYLKGNRILDVGCGPGHDSKWLKGHGYDVIGIDSSIGMLREARKRVTKVKFIKMDMRHLKFPKESFDGLWVCASLIHIPKRYVKKTLIGFRRVLKPGGVIYLGVKKGKSERHEVRVLKGPRLYVYYSKAEIEKLLRDIQSWPGVKRTETQLILSSYKTKNRLIIPKKERVNDKHKS